MAKPPRRPPAAGPEEDPNVEEIEVSSPPCFAHELDEAWRPRKKPPEKKDG